MNAQVSLCFRASWFGSRWEAHLTTTFLLLAVSTVPALMKPSWKLGWSELATSSSQPPLRDPSTHSANSLWPDRRRSALPRGARAHLAELPPPRSFWPPTALRKGTSALWSMLQANVWWYNLPSVSSVHTPTSHLLAVQLS